MRFVSLFLVAAAVGLAQSPCSVYPTQEVIAIPYSGSSASGLLPVVTQPAPCAVSLSSDSWWLHLTQNPDGTISYFAFSNTNSDFRSAHVLSSGVPIITVAEGAPPDVPVQTRMVTALYQSLLGREPDAAGLTFWTGAGAAALPNMIDSFMTSAEFMAGPWRAIAVYYVANGSAPTYSQWLGALPTAGAPAAPSVEATIASAAFKQNSNPLWILSLYYTILQRDADPAGLSFWLQTVNAIGPGLLFDSSATGEAACVAVDEGFISAEFLSRFQ